MALDNDFKAALASWVSGVSVVTATVAGKHYGLTVSSFSSLSLDPPLVLVCLQKSNRLPSMIEESQAFAVSILERSQEAASNYFASRGREPSEDFTTIPGGFSGTGQAVVDGALAVLSCRLHTMVPEGDHCIAVGEVVEAECREGEPLLYYRRAYRSVT